MNAAVPLKKVPVLKLILVIRNKSVQELANFVGNERSQVSTWVNGRDEPSREQAEKIAKFLKWDLDEIWEDPKPGEKAKRKSPTKKVGKQKLVDEGALKLETPPARHLHVVEVDPQLEVIDDISRHPGLVPITVYASIAAGGLDDHATVKEDTPAWVPKGYANCYGLRVSGTSMVDAGIDPEDILIVRLSTRAREERIVVALIENGATVKRYRMVHGEAVLVAEGAGHSNIPASDGFKVQGVVLGIHKRRR